MRFLLVCLVGASAGCGRAAFVDLTPSRVDAGSLSAADATSFDAASQLRDATIDGRDAAPLDAVVSGLDGGAAPLSDDCSRGTWCWERPRPNGEPAVGAAVYSDGRASYVTPSGVLQHFDGQWQSRVLDLPCTAGELWSVDPREVLIGCTNERGPHYVVQVTDRGTALHAVTGAGVIGRLSGMSRDAVWFSTGRGLGYFDGGTVRDVAGPGGDALLVDVLARGPNDLLVLESWGTAAGYGRLHHLQAGQWSLEYEFAQLRMRVEGPIVSASDGLWLRAYDPQRGVSAAAHFDGNGWSIVSVPAQGSGIRLHQVGERVWLVAGNRAWIRDENRWTEILDFPGGNGVLAGRGTDEAWVFSSAVAMRSGGRWRSWSAGTFPTLGFLRAGGGGAVLLSPEPPALWRPAAVGDEWSVTVLAAAEQIVGFAGSAAGPGWLATARGLMRVDANRLDPPLPWGNNGSGSSVMSATNDWVAVASSTGERVLRYRAGRPLDPIAPPSASDLNVARWPLDAVHVTASGTIYVAGGYITGDKQVHLRAYRWDGRSWTEIVRSGGVFGQFSLMRFGGETDDALWLTLGELHRIDGGRWVQVDDASTLVDFGVEADGTAIGLDGRSVFTWGARDGRRGTPLVLPRAAQTLGFSLAHRDGDGNVRVSTWAGQVMRYTP